MSGFFGDRYEGLSVIIFRIQENALKITSKYHDTAKNPEICDRERKQAPRSSGNTLNPTWKSGSRGLGWNSDNWCWGAYPTQGSRCLWDNGRTSYGWRYRPCIHRLEWAPWSAHQVVLANSQQRMTSKNAWMIYRPQSRSHLLCCFVRRGIVYYRFRKGFRNDSVRMPRRNSFRLG